MGRIYPVKPFKTILVLYPNPYTAERRDALGNTTLSDLEISLGWGFCPPISRNTVPRAVFPNALPRSVLEI